MAAFISAPVSSPSRSCRRRGQLSTSSLVPPNAASSKSWIAAAPFSARWVTIATGQPGVDQRAQTDLDHVAAQQKDHAAAGALGADDRIDDLAEVAGGKDVGQAVEEGGEGAVWSGG